MHIPTFLAEECATKRAKYMERFLHVTMTQEYLVELPDNKEIRETTYAELGRLDMLGSSHKIANFLIDRGIKGRFYNTLHDPLGIYISKFLGGGGIVTWVSTYWLCVYSSDRRTATWRVPVSLGRFHQVRKFIKDFDTGCYGELVDNVIDLH